MCTLDNQTDGKSPFIMKQFRNVFENIGTEFLSLNGIYRAACNADAV